MFIIHTIAIMVLVFSVGRSIFEDMDLTRKETNTRLKWPVIAAFVLFLQLFYLVFCLSLEIQDLIKNNL